MSHPTVYRFFNADEELLYVGSTFQPHIRWKEHKKRDWFREVAAVRVEHFDDVEEMKRAEWAAIKTESPRYNIAGRVPEPVQRPAMAWRSEEEWAARTAQHEADRAAIEAMPGGGDLSKLRALTAYRQRVHEDMEILQQELWEKIRVALAEGASASSLAKQAGISRARVYQIRDGK